MELTSDERREIAENRTGDELRRGLADMADSLLQMAEGLTEYTAQRYDAGQLFEDEMNTSTKIIERLLNSIYSINDITSRGEPLDNLIRKYSTRTDKMVEQLAGKEPDNGKTAER